jgi:alpha-N-acetylglucosaminidase
VFYELATDLTWRSVDVAGWLDEFAVQRYLAPTEVSDVVRAAWRALAGTLYAPGRTRSVPSPVYARPWDAGAPFATQRLAGEALPPVVRMSANVDAENDPSVLEDLPTIAAAARALVSVADAVGDREALARDVVDLVGHVIAQGTRRHIRQVLRAAQARDEAGVRDGARRLESDLRDLDALAATRAESRVSSWIAQARRWGGSPAEADVLERDARSLVSVWGDQSSGLHDYSGRHWSGLVRDLYLPRWSAWADWLADAVAQGRAPDVEELRARIVGIEETWRAAIGSDDASGADPLRTAARMLERHGR